jgi:hypothetical protein
MGKVGQLQPAGCLKRKKGTAALARRGPGVTKKDFAVAIA